MTAGRLIVRGASASAGGLVVRLGARLLFLVVAAQLYGAALFGAYALAVAAVELAVAVGGLGMKKLVFRHLDGRGVRAEIHVVADAAVLAALASAAIALVLMASAAWLSPAWLSPNTAQALFWLAPMIAGQALLDILLAATRWKHLIRYEVVGRSLIEPWAAVAAAAAAWYAGFQQSGLIAAYWCGTLAALAFASVGVRRAFALAPLRRWRMRRRRLVAIARHAAANAAADALSALLVRLDLYLVGILLGERAAGIYGVARQLALPVRQVRQSFDGLLTPLVAKTLRSGGAPLAARAIASAARLILALQLPMVVALIAVGQPLLDWLGPEFVAAWAAAVLLAAAETVQGAFGIGELLLAYRRPRLGLAIMAASLALGLVAGIALTSAWGLSGAAAAVLLTYSARAWARRQGIKRALGAAVPLRHVAGPALAGTAGGAAAILLLPPGWPAAAAAGLGAYVALLFACTRLTGDRLALDHFEAG